MTYDMNEESRRQELGRRLVEREVYYCVSSLVSTLSTLVQHVPYDVQRSECISWEDDILPLLESINYEEALRNYVMEDADVDDLESLIENDNYWDDFLEEKAYPKFGRPKLAPSCCADKVCVDCHEELQGVPFEEDRDASDEWHEHLIDVRSCASDFSGDYCGEEYDDEFSASRCDCCGSTLAGARYTYEKPEDMELQSIDEWLDSDKELNENFRELVFDTLVETSDLEELCREHSIDTDDYRDEVYEHWVVSDWLARKLKERGYTVGELCGLTIWGRGCTGQSIYLDRVIQDIALENLK